MQKLEASRDRHGGDIAGVEGLIAQMERYAIDNDDSPTKSAARQNSAPEPDQHR